MAGVDGMDERPHFCGDGCVPQHEPGPLEEPHGSLVIRRNEDGTIDEIITDPSRGPIGMHIEQMQDDSWWVGVSDADITHHINFIRRQRVVEIYYEEDRQGR